MSKEFENIIYKKMEKVARIIINRPEVKNALDMKTRAELREALMDSEKDQNIRVIIITGANGIFSSGADLRDFAELGHVEMREWLREYGINTITEIIMKMSKPVIALVDGSCFGGGLEIAMACDLIIATDRARFGQLEIRVGLIPGGGGTQRLPRLIGLHKAKEYIFTGNIIDAMEAEKIGLVNKVVSVDKLNNVVNEIIKRIVDKSPILIKLAKEAINATIELPLSAGLAYERELFLYGWGTEDRVEGIKAFLEKRKPVYKGR
jgi:enoyl-CoA hydratase